jgi:hypothetical protein
LLLARYSGSSLVGATNASFAEQSLALAKFSDCLDNVINSHDKPLRPITLLLQSSSCSGKFPERGVVVGGGNVDDFTAAFAASLLRHIQILLDGYSFSLADNDGAPMAIGFISNTIHDAAPHRWYTIKYHNVSCEGDLM